MRRLEPRRRCRRERLGGGARFLRRGGGGGAPAPPPPLEDPDRRPQSAGGQQGVLPRVSLRQGCEGGFRGGAEGRAPAWPPLRVVVPSRMALTTPTKRWRSPLARQTHTRTKYTTRHREHLRSHSLSCLPQHQLCASEATAQRGGAIGMERDAWAHSPCVRPTQCCSPGSAAEKITLASTRASSLSTSRGYFFDWDGGWYRKKTLHHTQLCVVGYDPSSATLVESTHTRHAMVTFALQ